VARYSKPVLNAKATVQRLPWCFEQIAAQNLKRDQNTRRLLLRLARITACYPIFNTLLEHKPQRQLHIARILRARDSTEAGRPAKCSPGANWRIEVWVVEEIENVQAKIQAHRFLASETVSAPRNDPKANVIPSAPTAIAKVVFRCARA
jgi:hypothetical protein